MNKTIRNTVITAAAIGAIVGAFWYRGRLEDRHNESLLERPYTIGVIDRFGYLKILADENRDGIIDRKEGEKMHLRMGVNGQYPISMDRGEVPFNLNPLAPDIDRAIAAYEAERK